VDGERGFVEVALKLESSSLDELVVVGIAAGLRAFAERRQAANSFEVYLEIRVSIGEQADGFGRFPAPQVEGKADSGNYQDDDECDEKALGAFAHSADVIMAPRMARECDVG
jgi:hypothetical protein